MSAYVTGAEYRARTGSTQDDASLTEQLLAASRMIDSELQRAPGHFAPIADATYEFDILYRSRELDLVDESGLEYSLRSVGADGITVTSSSGTVYTFDLTPDWIQAMPVNAVALDLPYTKLRLRASRTGTPDITAFPAGSTVEIQGAWGWAEIPGPIRELTTHVCRDFRDSLVAGAAGQVQVFDEVAQHRPDTWRLWRMVKRRWGNIPDGLRVR